MTSVDQVDLFITSHGGNEPFEFVCTLDRLLVRNLSEIVQVLVYLAQPDIYCGGDCPCKLFLTRALQLVR